jgi:hypothetical protein
MQNDTSKFVVNIIPLQNVNTSISGTNITNVLSNNVFAIQQMVNTSNNTIRANTIQSFTGNNSVNFISPINLSNVGITSNGENFSYGPTITTSTLTVSTISGTSAIFSGTVQAQLFVTSSDILAKTSIREWRSPVLADLQKIHPYIYNYKDNTTQDIGLIAQEIETVWPQLVKDSVKGKFVNYNGMVTILLKAVQELSARVSTLESR